MISHNKRFLVKGLPIDTTSCKVKQILEANNLVVKFCNIKAPSKRRVSSLRLLEFMGVLLFKIEMECYVEIVSDKSDEEVQTNIQKIFNNCTVQVVQNRRCSLQAAIAKANIYWYPDLFSEILKFFHGPPKIALKEERDNSYCELIQDGLNSAKLSQAIYSNIRLIPKVFDEIYYARKVAISIEPSLLLLNPVWKRDKQLVLIAVAGNGELLQNITTFQNDRQVVLEAVTSEPTAFQFASESLRKDKQIRHAAKCSLIRKVISTEEEVVFRNICYSPRLQWLIDDDVVIAPVLYICNEALKKGLSLLSICFVFAQHSYLNLFKEVVSHYLEGYYSVCAELGTNISIEQQKLVKKEKSIPFYHKTRPTKPYYEKTMKRPIPKKQKWLRMNQ